MAETGDLERTVRRFREELLRNERRAASQMVRYYGEAWKRIRAEVDALAKQIADARKRGEEVRPSWLYEMDRLKRLQAQVEEELRRFARFAEDEIVRQQREAVDAAQEHARELTMEALGVGTLSGVAIAWNRLHTAAVEDLIGFLQDGSPLRNLLMELGPEVGQGVADALVQGVALGLNPRDVARQVRRRFAMGLARALTISRTETLRAYREAAHRSYEANADVVKGWIWHAALGPRTCAACLAMHGTFHRLDERLDDHPNGRCTPVPVTRSWKEIGDRFGVDLGDVPNRKPEVTTGEEWLRQQTEEVQRRILGHAGYEAWRSGAVDLKDFAGWRQDRRWGRNLYRRSLREILGDERAQRWVHFARLAKQGRERTADRLKGLRHDDVVEIGRLASGVWRKVSGVTRQVVVTRERRRHYLERHPEVRELEGLLWDAIHYPYEVHRNKRDPQMIIIYVPVDGERFLRVALWISDNEKLMNSVLSARMARMKEVEKGRKEKRVVYRRRG